MQAMLSIRKKIGMLRIENYKNKSNMEINKNNDKKNNGKRQGGKDKEEKSKYM